MSDESAAIIIHVFITNKLDYCNLLLYSLPDFKNIAVDITQILEHLHQYISHSIQNYCSCFTGIHGVVPDYLCELITKHYAARALHSNDIMLLAEPKTGDKTYGLGPFIYVAPQNKIPLLIRKSINLSTNKSSIKNSFVTQALLYHSMHIEFLFNILA